MEQNQALNVEPNQPKRGVVRIIACGGIGTDNVVVYEEDRGQEVPPGFAQMLTCYVDTSDSDMDSRIPVEAMYRMAKKSDGTVVNGSGKLRVENGEEIARLIKEILAKFRPGDLTIVISSTSGGSGSVFAPFLAKELLDRDLDVIAFGIGTTGDMIEIRNNISTVKSYDKFARAAGKPLPFFYTQYGNGRPTADVQAEVQEVISGLAVLWSGQNKGIDGQDCSHWLNPTKTLKYQPKLLSLHMVSSTDKFKVLGQILSVASIGADNDSLELPETPDFRIRGISKVAPVASKPAHFVISEGHLIDTLDNLEAELTALEEKKQARVAARDLTKPGEGGDGEMVW